LEQKYTYFSSNRLDIIENYPEILYSLWQK
jgi:hypothetical protein